MAVVVKQEGSPVYAKVVATGYGVTQENAQIAFWLQSSLKRVYPNSEPEGGTKLEMVTPRNARLSFQACFRNASFKSVQVECEAQGVPGLQVQVRRVGFVPQKYKSGATVLEELEGGEHTPGFVPDPLYPEQSAFVLFWQSQSFWITVDVAADIAPGVYPVQVKIKAPAHNQEATMTVDVDVQPLVLQPRHDFPVTHWWNADCISDWHKIECYGEEFWTVVRPYLQNLRAHGTNVIYMSLMNIRVRVQERPPQLLQVEEVAPGRYKFDWSLVHRMVQLAKEIGFEKFEWTHFWGYGVEKPATRVYTKRNGKFELLFPADTDPVGEVYRNYLSQMLPEFKQFLIDEGILEQSYFHLSDEPTAEAVEAYGKRRQMLRELAPWIKVMDAINNPVFVETGYTDMPVPIAWAANKFLAQGVPHWAYYCCSPLGPYINRLFDTPLPKLRVQGFLFYHLKTLGFLHWAFNYWYVRETQALVDPFNDGSSNGAWSYGDPFVVYPSTQGPIDSIRWEIFAEALQDYALLQTLGINPDDELLQPIKNYGEFPKNEAWFKETYVQLFSRGEQATANQAS